MEICPKCKSSSGVREIIYGFPSEEPNEEVFAVGGCTVSENDPSKICIECGYEWEFKSQSEFF